MAYRPFRIRKMLILRMRRTDCLDAGIPISLLRNKTGPRIV
jgi:hypothetical protein